MMDDSVDDVTVIEEGVLRSPSSTYVVLDVLGQGAFGIVLRCLKTNINQTVALKVMKDGPRKFTLAKKEVDMMRRLQVLDPDECGIVRWLGIFDCGRFICLEFELLEMTLRDFAMGAEHRVVPLIQIRDIVEQLATALRHLGTLGIMHADLKPGNIMMTGQGTKVKIIDFGLSCHVHQVRIGTRLQSLWYRSPEVMLGLPLSCMIDMWSLGCVVAFLLIGNPIYPGDTEYDMWGYILQTHGEVPGVMLDQGINTSLCFTRGEVWRLKSPKAYEVSTGVLLCPHKRRDIFHSLEEVVQVREMPGQPIPPSLTDLLKRMLHLDANQRITPCALLEHPFIRPERVDHPEPSVNHHNGKSSLEKDTNPSPPVSHKPLLSEELRKETVNTTDSGEGTLSDTSRLQTKLDNFPLGREWFRLSSTPTSLGDVTKAAEEWKLEEVTVTPEIHGFGNTLLTVDFQPAAGDLQQEVTQKPEKKQGRVKRFLKMVLKSICSCCCLAHDDLD